MGLRDMLHRLDERTGAALATIHTQPTQPSGQPTQPPSQAMNYAVQPPNTHQNEPIVFQLHTVDQNYQVWTPPGGDISRPTYTNSRVPDGAKQRPMLVFRHNRGSGSCNDKENVILRAAFDQKSCLFKEAGEQKWERGNPFPNTQNYGFMSETGLFPGWAYMHMTFQNGNINGGVVATWFMRLFPPNLSERQLGKHSPSYNDTEVFRVTNTQVINGVTKAIIAPGFVHNDAQLDEIMSAAASIGERYLGNVAWHLYYDKKWSWDRVEECRDLSFLPTDLICESVPTYQEGSAEAAAEKKAARKEQAQIALGVGKLFLHAGKLADQIAQAEGVQVQF